MQRCVGYARLSPNIKCFVVCMSLPRPRAGSEDWAGGLRNCFGEHWEVHQHSGESFVTQGVVAHMMYCAISGTWYGDANRVLRSGTPLHA
jgi:hypothetical protein